MSLSSGEIPSTDKPNPDESSHEKDHEHEKEHRHHGGHEGGGHEEGGGGHAPLWIVSFADMVILLMSFFVIMLAMSTQRDPYDRELLNVLASIKVALGYRPEKDSKQPIDLEALRIISNLSKGKKQHSPPPIAPLDEEQSNTKVKQKKVAIKGRLGEPIFFKQYSYELPPDETRKIAQMAEIVRSHYRFLTILGHCSPQEAREEPDNGHQLAFRRAVAISNALMKHGISAPRLRLVSCAAFETVQEDPSVILGTRAELNLGTYFLPEKSGPR